MARYRLTNYGVVDTDRNAHIPDSMDNNNWVKYQQWLTDGGVPDPDPYDYLGAAKANAITTFWNEAQYRIDNIGAGFAVDAVNSSSPTKAQRNNAQHNKRLTKASKGQALTPQEDALHDEYDNFLDWSDLTYDAADTAEQEVEAAIDETEVAAVTATWPVYVSLGSPQV